MGKYGEILEDFYDRAHAHPGRPGAGREQACHHAADRRPGVSHPLSDSTAISRTSWAASSRISTLSPILVLSSDIRRVLTELGYEEDKQVTQLFGDRRMLFHDPAFGRHIDVFLNVLDFCHPSQLCWPPGSRRIDGPAG